MKKNNYLSVFFVVHLYINTIVNKNISVDKIRKLI